MFERPDSSDMRVGYVVKRYPRFSETFIVNEILAHEAAGLDVEIFSIRPCNDTHYQNRISEVRAPHTQLNSASRKASVLWEELKRLETVLPHLWQLLEAEQQAEAVSICQALTLAELVLDRGITHLHAHFATLPATVARLAALLAGIPYSLTAHAKDIFHESVRPDDLCQKIEDAAAIVTVSQFNVEYLVDQDVERRKIHRVYNGMHLEEFSYHEPTDRQPLILGVGRLVEKKGFDYLIRACQPLRDRGVDFSCVIVGSGDEEESLRQLIRDLALDDIVRLQGPMPQSQVKQLLRRASVMAAPCVIGDDGNRDGLPTVLLEAMAMGTPCVATDVTGIPEVIEHGKTGLIVPQNESVELGQALQSLLEDATLRVNIAEQARALIESQFDAHQTSRQLRKIFEASGVESALAFQGQS